MVTLEDEDVVLFDRPVTFGGESAPLSFTDKAGHCLLFAAEVTVNGKQRTFVGVMTGQPTYDALWSGVPKLLAELAARGIDTRKLRELDAGAVPVQMVKPETIDADLRTKNQARTGTTVVPQGREPVRSQGGNVFPAVRSS